MAPLAQREASMTSRDAAEHYRWGKGCDGWHLLRSESLSVIEERMPPGTAEVLHYHLRAQQLFYILSGTASFEIDGETVTLSANESLHVPKRALHRIENAASAYLRFLVISEPRAHGDRIEIIPFAEELREPIRTLNLEWLERYFRVEEGDIVSLNDPLHEIIGKGGAVFYARYNGEIVGTASLMRLDDEVCELGKMAVTDRAQGRGIGAALLRHALAVARRRAFRTIVLYSHTGLAPAIHLYRKHGFTEVDLEPGHYARANIKMSRQL
jgi:mannose-6-phosphate isomerase-like protein (cupin superfamily)/predicted GNAT family N-acyltransferase